MHQSRQGGGGWGRRGHSGDEEVNLASSSDDGGSEAGEGGRGSGIPGFQTAKTKLIADMRKNGQQYQGGAGPGGGGGGPPLRQGLGRPGGGGLRPAGLRKTGGTAELGWNFRMSILAPCTPSPQAAGRPPLTCERFPGLLAVLAKPAALTDCTSHVGPPGGGGAGGLGASGKFIPPYLRKAIEAQNGGGGGGGGEGEPEGPLSLRTLEILRLGESWRFLAACAVARSCCL